MLTPEPRGRTWHYVVGTLAGVFLGGVFLVAVWAKMPDISAFAELISHEGLDFLLPARPLAYVALAVEAAIGFALVLNLRRLWVLIPTALLLAFLFYVNVNAYLAWTRGDVPPTTACGCFGSLVMRTPAEALWQDALLLVPPLLLSFLGRPEGPVVPRVRTALVGLLTLGVVLFAWKAPDLPLDDLPLVTRLYPGVDVQDLCAGRGEDEVCLTSDGVAPRLHQGRHLVVLADLKGEEFATGISQRIGEFLDWEQNPETSRILVLHAGETEDELRFEMLSFGAPLDLAHAPHPLLRSLYRTIPRTFLVQDGKVVRTWNGLPPLSEVPVR